MTRAKVILEVKALELLDEVDDGIELNEGYEFTVNGSIPQIADGIAKLALAMNEQVDMGKNAGEAFLSLILEYYNYEKKEE